MAKVHPHLLSSLSSSFSSSSSSSLSPSFSRFEGRSINYTVWMKSLVFNGNGCTIFDANGNVVYRVDNYDSKSCTQVFLMDLKGRVLSTLLKKKLRVNEHWNGYKNDRVNKEKAWFQVKKKSKLFSKGDGFSCQVKIRGDDCEALSCFKIQGSCKKSEFKIVRGDGLMVAQVKRKQSKQGVLLGDDVLSLEIEPNLDHSFIISLVIVHGLMSHKM